MSAQESRAFECINGQAVAPNDLLWNHANLTRCLANAVKDRSSAGQVLDIGRGLGVDLWKN